MNETLRNLIHFPFLVPVVIATDMSVESVAKKSPVMPKCTLTCKHHSYQFIGSITASKEKSAVANHFAFNAHSDLELSQARTS